MTGKILASAAAIVFGLFSPASASVITVTDIGVVKAGYDGIGLFGAAGADLAGDSYKAVFTFDPSAASSNTASSSDALAIGGTTFGGSPKFVSEIVTIDGVSAPAFGDTAGEIYAQNLGSSSRLYHLAASVHASYDAPIYSLSQEYSEDYYTAPDGSIPLDFTAPGTYPSANGEAYGYFSAAYEVRNMEDGCATANYSYADLTLAAAIVAAAPEPSTWAMTLAGFAGVGVLVARRKRPRPSRGKYARA
jgi:hypothetical protein